MWAAPCNILIVCTGNTCRSPMAAVMLQQLVDADDRLRGIQVASAGTDANQGDPATAEAIAVVASRELDLRQHRARRLDGAAVAAADLILTMTARHEETVRHRFPPASDRVYRLAAWAGCGDDVTDPLGRGIAAYRQCEQQFAELFARMLERLVALREKPQ